VAPDRTTALLSEAVGLWRGDAYEEFTDIDPLRIEAARLDELRLVAIERFGEALLAEGRADAAIAELERLIEHHPFREQAVATIMRCFHATGRQGDALRAYTSYRRRLADELGLEPSATLRQLDHSIALGESQEPAVASATGQSDGHATLEAMRVGYIASARHPHLRLAIGTVGDGPPIVAVPAWVTSLDITMSSRDPRSALLERLASTFRVATYDQPGTGLSRGSVTDFSLDAAVADLRAVIENTGDDAVTLLAVSAAGPTAIALAARHPHLVDRLVLFGTFADPHVAFPDPDFSAALVAMVRARWSTGSGMLAQLYRPGASDDAARRLSAILRESADADAGAAYLAACYESDVSDLLAHVRHPALVIHYRGDKIIPFRGGEHLASNLPNAELLPIDGPYHLPDLADADRLTRAITQFAGPP
jgi:pimeloyl-ACP methyl ester carboxylesterase